MLAEIASRSHLDGSPGGSRAGERIFTCFVMVTGTSVYAYGITSVVSIATGAMASEREFTRQKDELNRYMRLMQMPKELQQSLREYFVHWQAREPTAELDAHGWHVRTTSTRIPWQASMMTFSERKMLGVLSPALQARITSLVNAPLIRQVHP